MFEVRKEALLHTRDCYRGFSTKEFVTGAKYLNLMDFRYPIELEGSIKFAPFIPTTLIFNTSAKFQNYHRYTRAQNTRWNTYEWSTRFAANDSRSTCPQELI